MLNVLEAAGLLANSHAKLLKDEKTGALIFGIEGLKGGLDKYSFDNLSIDLSREKGFKIFMFHAAVTEYSIPMMESIPLAALPRGFDYYANGHVHVRLEKDEEIGKVVFPGPIFPCDFTELEKVRHGSFCIAEVDDMNYSLRSVEFKALKMCDVEMIEVDGLGKHPKSLEEDFLFHIGRSDLNGKILLLKAKGILASGKPGDVDWKRITALAAEKGAVSVKRSIHLETPEADTVKSDAVNVEQIEEEILKKGFKTEEEVRRATALMTALAIEKGEDETSALFEERVKAGARRATEVL
jgi:DNA repair exonuclease SbcCD nuclease subunit